MFTTVSSPMVPTLSQNNPVHNSTLDIPSGLFLLSFPTKILYELDTSPMCATCYAHNILLNLIKNDNWKIVLIMKFLFVQFPPSSCHFIVRLNTITTPHSQSFAHLYKITATP